MSDLLPCPFCGETNLSVRYDNIDGWIAHIECLDCDGMKGPTSQYKYTDKPDAAKDASERWNSRPDTESDDTKLTGTRCQMAIEHTDGSERFARPETRREGTEA